MKKFSSEQAIRKALSLEKKGLLGDANLIYQEILQHFPGNKKAKAGLLRMSTQSDDPSSADPLPKQILELLLDSFGRGDLNKVLNDCTFLTNQYPKSPILWNIYGSTNQSLGHFKLAESNFKRALSLNQNFSEAWYNLGGCLRSQGRLLDAQKSVIQSIKQNENFFEAYFALGNILVEDGKKEEAISAFKRVVEINPSHAESHNNLGILLQESALLDESLNHYLKAIELKPRFDKCYFNLGKLFGELENKAEAAKAFLKTIEISPNFNEARYELGNLFKEMTFSAYSEEIAIAFLDILERKNIASPTSLSRSILGLLSLHPDLKKPLELQGELNQPKELAASLQALSGIKLLLEIMKICPIPNLRYEQLFIGLRRKILLHNEALRELHAIMPFCIGLALQCFVNEHIYATTPEEEEALSKLHKEVLQKSSKGMETDQLSLVTILMFKRVKELNFPPNYEFPSFLSTLNQRLILEPLRESELAQKIDSLGDISDIVSKKVKDQYEENPYPRWFQIGQAPAKQSITDFVQSQGLRIKQNKILEAQCPKILIAGCGTGQHPIQVASRFKDSEITAIDLSSASLSYAMRKTQEAGVSNIKYILMDILQVNKLETKFDIIESMGVLHHLEEPSHGLNEISCQLNSGGLMCLGLYSSIARRELIKIREKYIDDIPITRNEILAFRKHVIETIDKDTWPEPECVTSWNDFYSVSELRDLIFHTEEHSYKLEELKALLSNANLSFCGFQLKDNKIVERFRKHYPSDSDLFNLDCWSEFESANPHTFREMYQFWVQKED